MKPFLKEYTNDEQLQNDIKALQNKGVAKEDLYVLSHDKDRTDRIADNADANKVGFDEMDFASAVGNLFNKKGDALRTKLTEMGFSEAEAQKYEEDMDEGKVLLMVTNHDNAGTYLL